MNSHELAYYLNVSQGSIRVAIHRRRFPIPFIRVGRQLQFKVDDVKRFLNIY